MTKPYPFLRIRRWLYKFISRRILLLVVGGPGGDVRSYRIRKKLNQISSSEM